MRTESDAAAVTGSDERCCALVALGSNLASPWWHVRRAAVELSEIGAIVARSSLWLSEPVGGPEGQPPYLNGVIALLPRPRWATPEALLGSLHQIEARHGRVRRVRNAARTLDLDLLAFGEVVSPDGRPILPHPRMMQRAFVLAPLLEVAPQWRHPVTGRSAQSTLSTLGRRGVVRTSLHW